jgi:hypothetical protein
MKRLITLLASFASTPIAAVTGGLFLALFSAPAAASLYGYCSQLSYDCAANGSFRGTVFNPPIYFGFTSSSGPSSGDLFIDLLVPDKFDTPSGSVIPSNLNIVLTGTRSGTATLFSPSPWTSGDLDTHLGISATPTNPIGPYLSATLTMQRMATGFYVYQADLGTTTLQGTSNPRVSPLENISSGPLPGSGYYVVAFLNEGTATNPNFQATANDGAILVPEPASLLLLGTGFLALGVSRRRQSGCSKPR